MKRIIINALCGALLVLFAGCNEDESHNAIYIPDAGTAVKANFYIEDEPYTCTFNVAITPEHYPQLTSVSLPDDVTIRLKADPDKIAEYNQTKGTDLEALPDGCFTVSEQVMIKAGNAKSEPAIITLNAKNKIEPFKEYLLAVSIESVEGADADKCCQTIYFIFRGSMDARNMPLLDRKGWKALSASSEEPREGDWGHGGLKESCLDGDLSTFWGTDWSTNHPQPPHWIVIDLGKSLFLQGFACRAREEGYDGPKEATVEVSDDNSNWTVAARFKDIPVRGEFRSFFPKAVNGRYLKVTITAVSGGPHVTVSELNLF